AQSWQLDPRPLGFVVKRVLRLWPALIVVVILSAAVLGPAVTTWSQHDYFASPLPQDYVTSNIGLDIVYNLPGVFHSNPFPDGVNGSLWTLPVEAKAYLIVLVLGVLRIGRRPAVIAALLALLVWVLVMPHSERPRWAADWLVGPAHTRLTIIFVGGMLLFSLRKWVRLWWPAAAAFALAIWATMDSSTAVNA